MDEKLSLPKLAKVICIADARYFCSAGFEPMETLPRVEAWVKGRKDPEIRLKVLSWLKSDIIWIQEVRKEVIHHFWYHQLGARYGTRRMIELINDWIRIIECDTQ